MDRPPDPTAMVLWPDMMRKGNAPEKVLSLIIGSPEYYQGAGNTPEGFLARLLNDLTGRWPTQRELSEWLPLLQNQRREDVALAILQRHGRQAWLPPADPRENEFLGGAGDALRRLTAEVEHLAEDILVELRGREQRELYHRADAVLNDLRHFQRSLRAGADRGHLLRDFQRVDASLEELTQAVRQHKSRALDRDVARVTAADQRLHLALAMGHDGPNVPTNILRRQARALAIEARGLRDIAGPCLEGDQVGRRLERRLGELGDACEHFSGSVKDGEDPRHLRRDFAAVEEAWADVVQTINRLPPAHCVYLLRSRAQQAGNIYAVLHQQMGLQGDVPRVVMPHQRADQRDR
jgi:hypothetical protein